MLPRQIRPPVDEGLDVGDIVRVVADVDGARGHSIEERRTILEIPLGLELAAMQMHLRRQTALFEQSQLGIDVLAADLGAGSTP